MHIGSLVCNICAPTNRRQKVVFQGETSFGYKEWKGPLIRMSGNGVTVRGDPGHVINGGGEQWWDGKGGSGKEKPKFFYAHNLDNSTISNLNVKNTPVQAFSVQSNNIVLDSITIDDSAGDKKDGGHNTDAFDVGGSGVTIKNANVKNQDDCLAVNSGEVCLANMQKPFPEPVSEERGKLTIEPNFTKRTSSLPVAPAPAVMVFLLDLWEVALIIQSKTLPSRTPR